jgi:hypothetical protein
MRTGNASEPPSFAVPGKQSAVHRRGQRSVSRRDGHIQSRLGELRSQALGVLKIDLSKQAIEHLTGVATDPNCLGQHTPQTMIGSEPSCRSTLRTDNRLLLQIDRNRNAHVIGEQVETRFTRIDDLFLPLILESPFLALPITLSTENVECSFTMAAGIAVKASPEHAVLAITLA